MSFPVATNASRFSVSKSNFLGVNPDGSPITLAPITAENREQTLQYLTTQFANRFDHNPIVPTEMAIKNAGFELRHSGLIDTHLQPADVIELQNSIAHTISQKLQLQEYPNTPLTQKLLGLVYQVVDYSPLKKITNNIAMPGIATAVTSSLAETGALIAGATNAAAMLDISTVVGHLAASTGRTGYGVSKNQPASFASGIGAIAYCVGELGLKALSVITPNAAGLEQAHHLVKELLPGVVIPMVGMGYANTTKADNGEKSVSFAGIFEDKLPRTWQKRLQVQTSYDMSFNNPQWRQALRKGSSAAWQEPVRLLGHLGKQVAYSFYELGIARPAYTANEVRKLAHNIVVGTQHPSQNTRMQAVKTFANNVVLRQDLRPAASAIFMLTSMSSLGAPIPFIAANKLLVHLLAASAMNIGHITTGIQYFKKGQQAEGGIEVAAGGARGIGESFMHNSNHLIDAIGTSLYLAGKALLDGKGAIAVTNKMAHNPWGQRLKQTTNTAKHWARMAIEQFPHLRK